MVAKTNHIPGKPTGLKENRRTPTGAKMTEDTANRHHAKTSGSSARFNIKFHEACAKADSKTSTRDTVVMGRSIALVSSVIAENSTHGETCGK